MGRLLALPRSAALRAAAGDSHKGVKLIAHGLRARCGRDDRAPACGVMGAVRGRARYNAVTGIPLGRLRLGLYSTAMVLVVTLLLAGAILLLAETVLPGMIAGIFGMLCLIAGVTMGYQEFGAAVGNWILLGTLVGLLIGFVLWVRYFPSSRFGRRYASDGVVGDIGTERPELVGQTGVAHTALRPAGVANISGQRVDVVTEGAMIERGAPVQVVAVEGLRVVVRQT